MQLHLHHWQVLSTFFHFYCFTHHKFEWHSAWGEERHNWYEYFIAVCVTFRVGQYIDSYKSLPYCALIVNLLQLYIYTHQSYLQSDESPIYELLLSYYMLPSWMNGLEVCSVGVGVKRACLIPLGWCIYQVYLCYVPTRRMHCRQAAKKMCGGFSKTQKIKHGPHSCFLLLCINM